MTTTDDANERARASRRRDLQRRARAKARAEGINYTTALRLLLAEESAAEIAATNTVASGTRT